MTEIGQCRRHARASAASSSTIRTVATAAFGRRRRRGPGREPPGRRSTRRPPCASASSRAIATRARCLRAAGDEWLEEACQSAPAYTGSAVLDDDRRADDRAFAPVSVTSPPSACMTDRRWPTGCPTPVRSRGIKRARPWASLTTRECTCRPTAIASCRDACIREEPRQPDAQPDSASTRCVMASSSPTSPSRRSIWPSISPIASFRRSSSPASAFSPCNRAAAIGLRISCATPAATRPRPARRSARGLRPTCCPLPAARLRKPQPGFVQGIDDLIQLTLCPSC